LSAFEIPLFIRGKRIAQDWVQFGGLLIDAQR
jgi:hypothetical protein